MVPMDTAHRSPDVFEPDWVGETPTECGSNYHFQTRVIDNKFRYWWSSESLERAQAGMARSKVGCYAAGTLDYILDKGIEAKMRPNARVGTTRNEYAKNVHMYDFVNKQIGLIDCTGGKLDTCSEGEYVMALKNLAKRQFPKVRYS